MIKAAGGKLFNLKERQVWAGHEGEFRLKEAQVLAGIAGEGRMGRAGVAAKLPALSPPLY